MKNEILYMIGLNLIPRIGPKLAKKLIAHCGGAKGVFEVSASILQKIPQIGTVLAKEISTQNVLKRADLELAYCKENGIRVLTYKCPAYPQRLLHCEDSPTVLYVKGNTNLNSPKIISVVGSRKATSYGKKWTQLIIEQLRSHQCVIVSGLAYGVDTFAHKAALANDLATVGVLGHGLDRIYPASNRNLSQNMIQKGALITEFLTETNPDRENFVKRNRIIAALSDATIVVESAKKGGALITAQLSNSYNRDVFPVPGPLDSEFSEGCNHLIKTHQAALLTSVADIEYLLSWNQKTKNNPILFTYTPQEEQLVSLLSKTELLHIDKIVMKSTLSSSKVSKILLSLEIRGAIQSLPGKRYKLS
jgi:DNA processing protein